MKDTLAIVFAACVVAESNKGDITTTSIAKRTDRTIAHTQDRISELRLAGLLEYASESRNVNERYHRLTDAGYAKAGIQRPFWMEKVS